MMKTMKTSLWIRPRARRRVDRMRTACTNQKTKGPRCKPLDSRVYMYLCETHGLSDGVQTVDLEGLHNYEAPLRARFSSS